MPTMTPAIRFEKSIRKFYVMYGFLKGVSLAALGMLLASNVIPLFWVIFIGVSVGLLMVIAALIGDYPRDMKWHRTLTEEVGKEYDDRLSQAVADHGLSGIVRTDWFVKTYEELYWNKQNGRD